MKNALGRMALLLLVAAVGLGGYAMWDAQKNGRGLLEHVAALLGLGAEPAKTELVAGDWDSPYATADDRVLNVAGAALRVRLEGPEDAPPIILLHGFTHSLEAFDAWAADLSRDHRVIRYDLLGHGLTGPDPQKRYAPAERAAFLGAVMDALGVKRASIAGNSLGGLIAWRFAAAEPARVDRLILIAPGAFPINGVTDTPAPIPPTTRAFLENPSIPGVSLSFGFLYADGAKIDRDRVALAQHMMARDGNPQAAIEHLEVFTLPDPVALLGKIKAPTLVQWGQRDALIPVAQAALVADATPGAELIIYEAGHVPHEELAEETVADARTFLAGER